MTAIKQPVLPDHEQQKKANKSLTKATAKNHTSMNELRQALAVSTKFSSRLLARPQQQWPHSLCVSCTWVLDTQDRRDSFSASTWDVRYHVLQSKHVMQRLKHQMLSLSALPMGVSSQHSFL